MRLHTVYRSAPGENRKNRPPFYSKEVALRSFVAAIDELPEGERIFVNDGDLPDPRRSLMESNATEMIQLDGVGNARSYRACVALTDARSWSDDDIVYFAEDDYLYAPGAFRRLAEAVEQIRDGAYFTLYDHPDYYSMRAHRTFSRIRRHPEHALADVSWRQVRSTCLTYAARVGAIRRDSWVHYLCSRDRTPLDYPIWSIVEGAGGFIVPRLLKPAPRPDELGILRRHIGRLVYGHWPRNPLYACRPGLATHLETTGLSPGRDWAGVAAALAS